MQSTATTSVNILPVLDIGPPPGIARDPTPAGPFEVLVAPPPACPPPPEPRLESANGNQPASDGEAVPDAADQTADPTSDSRPNGVSELEREDTAEIPPDSEAELIAASLAGAAAAVGSPAEAPAQAADGVEAGAEAMEPAATISGSAAIVGELPLGLPGAVATEGTAGKPNSAQDASEQPAEAADRALAATSGDELSPPGAELPEGGDDEQEIASEASQFTVNNSAAERPNQDETGKGESSHQQAADAAPSAAAPSDAAALSNSSELAPLASPEGNRPTIETRAASPSPAPGIEAAGNSTPRRLPAAMLAPEPAVTRTPIAIDSARLLHRVARAFTAAQLRDGEMQLRLSPPELGSLRLHVQLAEGALVARLEAETTTARAVLLDNLPALRERLAEQGLRIERFDVDLMQRHGSGTPDRPHDRESQTPQQPPVAVPRPVATNPTTSRPAVPRTLGPSQLNVIV